SHKSKHKKFFGWQPNGIQISSSVVASDLQERSNFLEKQRLLRRGVYPELFEGLLAMTGNVLNLEALRKPLSGSGIVKFTLGRRSKFAEHQVKVAELEHRGGGFRFALVVFAIAPGPAVPRIRALHDPAF